MALVRQRLGVAAIPDALAMFVTERVDGHPFFCEELLRAMQDSGVIRVSDGTCTVGDLARIDLPTTVEGVIVSRLDRLTPGQQLCLKVASVIGRVFRARMVQETHPVDAERPLVGGHLGALTVADLTAIESPEPDLAYLFKHVITRDVAYESMPYAQRQPLHRSAAMWYERHHGDDLAPHYALLAYHWARAADAAKAVHYLDKASEQALGAGAFRETVVFLTQAIELVDSGQAQSSPFAARYGKRASPGRSTTWARCTRAASITNEPSPRCIGPCQRRMAGWRWAFWRRWTARLVTGSCRVVILGAASRKRPRSTRRWNATKTLVRRITSRQNLR